jgi:uncharacterized protein (TIGR03118 family)
MSYGEFLRPAYMRGALVVGLLIAASHASAQVAGNSYVQTNLVSDMTGVAPTVDANLINPWGLSASSSSPLWVANNGTSTSTVYTGAGAIVAPGTPPVPLVVTIPPPAGAGMSSGPTGTVHNGSTAFMVNGKPAAFLFSTIAGTIAGWNGGTMAVTVADNSAAGAVYTGLALGADANGPLLYAPNFKAGTVDVFNGSFAQVNVGAFSDPFIPPGFAPFGIMTTPKNDVIVTYALQNWNATADVAGAGHGYVDEFSPDGNLMRRLISGGALDSPWGLALAPASGFGAFNGALLVGNFGDGRINAYTFPPAIGAPPDAWFGFFDFFNQAQFIDTMRDAQGRPLTILGLWGLLFGNGGANGSTTSLYFAAGIPGSVGTLDTIQQHGLVGMINAAPAPTPTPTPTGMAR